MGHFHFHAKVISRRNGRSAVAAAAYRSGEKLRNDYEDCVADFSNRRGVIHTEILAPDGAAAWTFDREALWNEAEASERRKDAQLAREVEVALPFKLTDGERLDLLRRYVNEQFVSRGMVADIAIHKSHKDGDSRNVHAHIMLTTRKLLPRGFGPKVREWNDKSNVRVWRREWARHQNEALARAGHAERVDHRSYKEQGIDKRAGIHEGPKARKMRQNGYQPRSRAIRRVGWKGQRRVIDYRRCDQGRTRHQRNTQIAWANQVRSTAGPRLATAVACHVHRRQLHQAWQQTRQAGQALRRVNKAARREAWLAERAAQIQQLHQQKLQRLVQTAMQLPKRSEALEVAILYRCMRLAKARHRARAKRAGMRRSGAAARRAAVQYRNLKHRIGAQRAEQLRRQVAQRHEAALGAVRGHEILASSLPNKQKADLHAAWRWARGRSHERLSGR